MCGLPPESSVELVVAHRPFCIKVTLVKLRHCIQGLPKCCRSSWKLVMPMRDTSSRLLLIRAVGETDNDLVDALEVLNDSFDLHVPAGQANQ